MPDLRQLRSFLAVAEHLSFTRAAEVLHLQQQTVSKTIRQLEQELGVDLFERTTREVRLTAAGSALRESGGPVVRSADEAFARVRQIGDGSLGRLRIGVTPAIGLRDCAEVLEVLRVPNPEMSVAFHDVRPGELRRMLRDRELDLGLTRSDGTSDPRLHSAELRPTSAVLCVPAEHPLAEAESVGLEQLEGERLLLPSAPGTPYADVLLARFAAAGVSVTAVEAHITGGPSILTELRATNAVALVANGTPLPEGVAALATDVGLPLLLLWPAGLPSPAVHRLREAMAASA